MTSLPLWRPTPGPDGYQQPKRKIVWEEDIPWREIAKVGTNPNDQGLLRRLIHPEVNGSPDVEFFFGTYRMAPGEYHPLHIHPGGAEFYYVKTGQAKFWVDDEIVDGRPGLALYYPAGTRHAIKVDGDEPLEIVYGFSPPDIATVGMTWLE